MATIRVINHTDFMSRRSEKIQYIILHYSASTGSDGEAAMGTVRTLDARGYSSDFAVDDNVIIQFASDPAEWQSTAVQKPNSKGTAAGKNASNANSVSIEMSSTLDNGGKWVANDPHFRFTQKVLENTAYLCRMLIAKYNIPKQNVIRHFDIMGKLCPGVVGWNTGQGSPDDNEYRAFVDSLYSGKTYVAPEPNYEYTTYYASNDTRKKTTTRSSQTTVIPKSNNVNQLAAATKEKMGMLKQDDKRKSEFETLANAMSSNAPQMGRDILLTSELYGSNILKGSQESRKERT